MTQNRSSGRKSAMPVSIRPRTAWRSRTFLTQHHLGGLPQRLGLVWNLLLKAGPDGPAILFYAALRYGFQFILNPFPCLCSTPFFLVSTEITGCRSANAVVTWVLM